MATRFRMMGSRGVGEHEAQRRGSGIAPLMTGKGCCVCVAAGGVVATEILDSKVLLWLLRCKEDEAGVSFLLSTAVSLYPRVSYLYP
ncbi:hypothetical protein A4A49_16547 [Nicotiana attenuata]|uniref:Uncharacterized protein n=1 Tax=Nicotiana attenuata TaxID=49451 RepID=A0A1J6I465_NICAT|nr:hypothetical protein A4A49_16547 [Nicotiana attenuata]